MGRQVVVDIVGDESRFTRATSNAINQTSTLGGRLSTVGKGIALGAGIGAFNLLTGAISAGVGALGEARDAFLADEVSQQRLATALKNNIPNWDGNTAGAEKFAGAQMALGFADDEVRDSLGKLVGVTHDVTRAQELSSLAMDLARAKNISLEQATSIVTKAHLGNGKALKSLGIDAAGATDAAGFLDAIQKNVAGSAKEWAATNEGKLAASNVKVGEAMEKVGGIVTKVAAVAVPLLADALETAIDAFTHVAAAVEPVVRAIIANLQPAIQKLGPVFTTVMAGIRTAITALQPIIQALGNLFGAVFGAIQNIVRAAVTVLSAVWRTWGNDILNVARTIFGFIQGTIQNAMRIIEGIIRTITAAIRGNWSGVWSGIRMILSGVWDQIRNVVTTGLTFIRSIITTVLNAIGNIVRTIWTGITTTIGNALTTIRTRIIDGFNTVVNFLRGIPGRIGSALGGMWNGIWTGFRSVINSVIRAWNSLKFTVPSIDLPGIGTVGGFTIGTPNIGYLHTGGIVPGVPGQNVHAILQAGERVLPRTESGKGGGGVTVVVNGNVYGGPVGLDALAADIAWRLRLQGVTT